MWTGPARQYVLKVRVSFLVDPSGVMTSLGLTTWKETKKERKEERKKEKKEK
jgi:hypothetical protein